MSKCHFLYLLSIVVTMKMVTSLCLSWAETWKSDYDAFLSYEMTEIKSSDQIKAMARNLRHDSKMRNSLYEAVSKLLTKLELEPHSSLKEQTAFFNDQELKDVLNYDQFNFQPISCMGKEYNRARLLYEGVSFVGSRMHDLREQRRLGTAIRPFVTDVKMRANEMDVTLTYGSEGIVEGMSYEFGDQTQEINRLPFKLSDSKGSLKIYFVHPVTKERRWYETEL